MTEEIIIDGVDVAGCKNYVHIEEERYKPECNCRLTTVELGYYCDTYATSVCEEENCEYKQLKRLEQENALLKEQLLKKSETEQSFQSLLDENKELKGRCQKLSEDLSCSNGCLRNKIDIEIIYRSALEGIREKIKSLNKDICNNCGWHNTDNCQPNGYVCHDLIEIKNKINEVLNHSEG